MTIPPSSYGTCPLFRRDVAGGSIEGGTFGDCCHRVHRSVDVGCHLVLQHLAQIRGISGAAHEDELGELVAVKVIALQNLLADDDSLLEEGFHDGISHLAGDGQVKFNLLAIVIASQLAEVRENLCAGSSGEFNLGGFGIHLQSLAQYAHLTL